jgi:hypothetical protein
MKGVHPNGKNYASKCVDVEPEELYAALPTLDQTPLQGASSC